MKPPTPTNETERLAALASYHILDSEPEQDFDDLVRIATHLCDAPAGSITLIDHDRQWHKAKIGLPVTETPRDVAFCAHTIMEDEPVVVLDMRHDERFSDNPFVAGEPHARFYAGVPLIMPDGFKLGTLCVIDLEPRVEDPLSETQIECLKALARQTVRLIGMRRTGRQLADALERTRLLDPLVPVCAWCNRVRDDEDFWSSVADYLREHAGVATTHGLCPDCYDRMDEPT